MAGIYIHIPFCKQACNYCNFHFTTSLKYKTELLQAIEIELAERQNYIAKQVVETIYFGGGTPSLLSPAEIMRLLDIIQKKYTLASSLEITLEANPDDLTNSYLAALRQQTPINRFSIGIQSFWEEDLQFMNRAHSAEEAQNSIRNAQNAGFENLTIDLIYGSPTTTHQQWENNLQKAFDLAIPHLSCYALTVENKTVLENHIRRGKKPAVEDNHVAEQFEILLGAMQKNDYEQYEISNFCRPPHYAKHNTNYWKGGHYLGVGPAAHSFNGHSRQWNIAHNPKYIKAIKEQSNNYWEIEELTPENQHNEYIMTALRTKWGVKTKVLQQWGNHSVSEFENKAKNYILEGYLSLQNGAYILSPKGKLIADHIMADFFC